MNYSSTSSEEILYNCFPLGKMQHLIFLYGGKCQAYFYLLETNIKKQGAVWNPKLNAYPYFKMPDSSLGILFSQTLYISGDEIYWIAPLSPFISIDSLSKLYYSCDDSVVKDTVCHPEGWQLVG